MATVSELLTALANSIRSKTNVIDKISLEEMAYMVDCIESTTYNADPNTTDWGYFCYNNHHTGRVGQLKSSDTIKGISFANMFRGSDKLTRIPDLSTPNGTNFSGMFYSNKALLKSPALSSTRQGIDFSYMYNACVSMTETPQIDTRNGEYLQYMFWNCQTMADPLEIISNEARNLEGLVRNSYLLPSLTIRIPNPGRLTSTVAMCHSCKALETVTGDFYIGTSGAKEMFCGCDKLHTIGRIRINPSIRDNATDVWTQTFEWCYGLVNLDISGKNKWTGLNLKHSKKLSKESIIKVINTLSDEVTGKSITLSVENVDNVFENGSAGQEWSELIATKPNWTIALM